ncbi:MAG: hypothetical protein O8C66_14290 [Candidatus Methanoperedens sp.]|nr:hypothetical protein [Candidatus Methanoperedens sp.]MCZ7371669.1 hypothetical protein [Candidatus Methanoperedens sp.]
MCQITAGVETCDDQSHDYIVREYYLPHIGFGGFYRSGTSVFTGGGLYDKFTSTMDMWLTDTNII